ncbi:phage tail protein [Fibrella sp. ES10-3-2-2]|nr:hypothetical protein A6C57_00360 [Fibrella sp. ES10-3-2-2]
MGSPVVHKKSGDTLPLRRRSTLTTITSARQSRTLLGDDTVSMTVESSLPMPFDIGDAVAWFGERYTLNRLPKEGRNGTMFVYELTFEGSQYSLRNLKFFNLDVLGFSSGAEFSLTGDLSLFAGVLLSNIQRDFPDWTLGEVASSTVKTLSFSNENCLAVLQRLCQEFETEFDLVRVTDTSCTVHLRKVGTLLSHVFRRGRHKGLYTLARESVGQDYFTRLYAFGGTKNLPIGYRGNSQRLRMATAGSWLENEAAKAAFGLIEDTKQFDDIFPHRTGTISTVGGAGLTFVDSGMDFDLNSYLQPGVTAKVSMKTGALAGRGFEVSSYVHTTQTFTIIPYTDDQGMTFPASTAYVLAPGDTYVLLDIQMPQSYIDSAEQELTNAAGAYLDANCAPRVQYSLEVDEGYLKRLDAAGSITNFFNLGDVIQILDQELGIDKASRILSYERDLLNPYSYNLTIADSYEISLIERILADQKDIKTVIQINDLRDSKKALYGWKIQQELLGLFFDTDGKFDGSKIRPETIEAGSLAIGAKSQQLILNVVIEPNFNGLANAVRVNAGSLIHYTIDEAGPKNWLLTAQSTTITDNAARYIYAKCHRTNSNDAVISFDTAQRKVDSDSTYYYFLIGYLHTVIDGIRFISLTYGATTINGRFIRTGRIQSADGSTYFDLDTGEIGGRINFTGNGGGDTSLEQLEAEFTYLQNVTLPNLRKSLTGKIVSYFQTNDPNTWSEAQRPLHDGEMWYKLTSKQLFRYAASSNSWVEEPDKTAVAAYEKAAQAQEAADGKIQHFIVQPYPPYDLGDLWTDGTDLKRCIIAKGTGQVYNPLDWDLATQYDNTKVTIDNGVVTAGAILLSSIAGTIRAGITGLGPILLQSAVRFFAGASLPNREQAPFRVLDNGEVFARKRIEVLNQNNIGQAGLCGANTAEDGTQRFWAGTPYESRATAPFQVFADGAVKLLKGLIGKLTISDGGLIAVDGGSTVQIDVNRPDPAAATSLVNMRSVSQTSNVNVFENVALYVSAKNTADRSAYGGINPRSYALFADEGMALLTEGLLNGRAGRYFYASANRTVSVNAEQVDSVAVYSPVSRIDITVTTPDYGTGYILNGKEITFTNLNNANSNCFLKNVVQANETDVRISGGEVVTIVYHFGYWLVKTRFDNEWLTQLINIPTTDL